MMKFEPEANVSTSQLTSAKTPTLPNSDSYNYCMEEMSLLLEMKTNSSTNGEVLGQETYRISAKLSSEQRRFIWDRTIGALRDSLTSLSKSSQSTTDLLATWSHKDQSE